MTDFNPHPLWRGWRSWVDCHMFRIAISIHTLCEEGDAVKNELRRVTHNFNPHPLWRGWLCSANISINSADFNPHPLWRGWPRQFFLMNFYLVFQSTPSVKRVTLKLNSSQKIFFISIHTLCEEGDISLLETISDIVNFNPHPLWRGWRGDFPADVKNGVISIHTLCEEGD